MENSRMGYIDVMRAMAILVVVAVHSSQCFGAFGIAAIDHAFGYGMYGVQLFFIASAFTLFLSYDRRKDEHYPVFNFYLRRFFRIVPLYYLGMVYYWFQNESYGGSIWEIVANVLFINEMNPYWVNPIVPGGWSVAVEMTFYCFVPWLFAKIDRLQKGVTALIIAVFGNALLHFIMVQLPVHTHPKWYWGWFLYSWPPSQLPVFFMGVLMYFILVKNESLKSVRPWQWILIAGMLLVNAMFELHLVFYPHIVFAFFFLVLGIGMARAMELLPVKAGWMQKTVVRLMMKIGKISYSMYLIHFAVLYWMVKYGIVPRFETHSILNYVLWYLMVTAVSMVLAVVTYRFVEKPFVRLGKTIIARREQQYATRQCLQGCE